MKENIFDVIHIHKAKLNNLVETGAPYSGILRKSQLLDEYIVIAMKQINE